MKLVLLTSESNTLLDVIIAIIAVLILAAVIVTPIIRKAINKKKGNSLPPKCAACGDSKADKHTNLKMNYDKKYKSKKKKDE